MAERDRDRRAKLVRRVLDESTLAFEQARVVHRDALNLLGGRQATPRVPHHRGEHRGHERHLGELIQLLPAPDDVLIDQRARGHHHEREDHHRWAGPPDAEPVQDRQAHPDEVERDRLPLRYERHRGEVREREEDPRDVDPPVPLGPLWVFSPHRRGTPLPGP